MVIVVGGGRGGDERFHLRTACACLHHRVSRPSHRLGNTSFRHVLVLSRCSYLLRNYHTPCRSPKHDCADSASCCHRVGSWHALPSPSLLPAPRESRPAGRSSRLTGGHRERGGCRARGGIGLAPRRAGGAVAWGDGGGRRGSGVRIGTFGGGGLL